MSIYAYTGLPGSGKSFAVVANVIIPALRHRRRVVTNIPLKLEGLAAAGCHLVDQNGAPLVVEFPTQAVQTKPELIDDFCKPGDVVVLDEVWRLWPAGLKSNQVPECYRTFLAEHRHRVDAAGDSMQINLVTQDLAQVAAFASMLVESTLHHTKMSHIGADGAYRVDICMGAVKGKPTRGSILRQAHGRYNARVYACYSSHTMSVLKSGAGANEKAVDRRASVWRRPVVWIGAVGVVGAVVFGVTAIAGLLAPAAPLLAGESAANASKPRVPQAQSFTGAREPASMPRSAVAAKPSVPSYRISGFVHGVDGGQSRGFAAISAGDRQVQVPWSECWEAGDGLLRCNFSGWVVTQLGVESGAHLDGAVN